MMKFVQIGTIFSVLAWLAGCGRPNADLRSRYNKALLNAVNGIPFATEFVRLFPNSYGSLSHFGGSYGPETLNLEASVDNRFIIRLQVPVTFATNQLLLSHGEPKFAINEVVKVEQLADNRWDVTFNPETSRSFGTNEWKELLVRNGDLRSLGVARDDKRSVAYFSRFWKTQRPQTRVNQPPHGDKRR
jgi:hypothetical protein